MLGPLALLFYRVICAVAAVLPGNRSAALRAKWALRSSAVTDGGLDDDFAEQVFQLALTRPGLLDDLEPHARGNGLFALRRRMTLDTLRVGYGQGARSLF